MTWYTFQLYYIIPPKPYTYLLIVNSISVQTTLTLVGICSKTIVVSSTINPMSAIRTFFATVAALWCWEKESERVEGSFCSVWSMSVGHHQGEEGHQGLPRSPLDPSTCALSSCRLCCLNILVSTPAAAMMLVIHWARVCADIDLCDFLSWMNILMASVWHNVAVLTK